ncbi:hypothetical protein L7F22_062371 [Adiantum nelumboides]|nr:hypothetical protein [Adiantum nelumboides]
MSNFDFVFLTAKDRHAMSDWIIDSGASLHVSPHKERFTSYVATKDYVKLGNEQVCDILGVGDVQLKFQNGSYLWLKNAIHVPAIQKSLISIGKLDDAGYVTVFGKSASPVRLTHLSLSHFIFVDNIIWNITLLCMCSLCVNYSMCGRVQAPRAFGYFTIKIT